MIATQPPRPRPTPHDPRPTARDVASFARSPAIQQASAKNAADAAAREARAAALEKQRLERLEQQAVTAAAVREAEAVTPHAALMPERSNAGSLRNGGRVHSETPKLLRT